MRLRREDRGSRLVLIRYEDLLGFLVRAKEGKAVIDECRKKTVKTEKGGADMKGVSAELYNRLVPSGTILLGYRGSVAHGTYTPEYGPDAHDDKDLLGVAVGPLTTYFGLSKFEQRERTEAASDGVLWDSVVYELRKYIRLLLKCNPNVLSLLFLPEHMYVIRTDLGTRLIENRDIFCSREAYNSFVGYARGQLHRMTHGSVQNQGAKRKALVEKFGYDTKNASHLIRILRLGVEFLAMGELNVEREDAQELIEIKKGEWALDKVIQEANRLFAAAQEALIHSPLPQHPDRDRAEGLCIEIMMDRFTTWPTDALKFVGRERNQFAN